jgi:nucleoside-triphosphatase THEP1
MQDKMRQRQYVMTLHAEEEMTDDGLSIYDIEAIVDSGMILERQKDQNTKTWKYRVHGRTLEGGAAEVIARLSLTGNVVIITVYLC